MATKRSTKSFSRNPKNKAQVLASKSSVRKANVTFLTKPQAPAKTVVAKIKKVRPAVQAPVIAPVIPPVPTPVAAPVAVVSPEVEQANKLAITLQLVKINDALKAVKIAERAKCDKHIQEAEAKAIAARAAVYRKAQKAGKFPTTWTYPTN